MHQVKRLEADEMVDAAENRVVEASIGDVGRIS
jgi:hypothetical protein